MKTEVYNLKNEVVGTIDLPEGIFGIRWNPKLIQQILLAHLANARKPWAHAKGRGEVRGGGKKPWRQKGTGRARHGSIRSPLWRGGGKAHGPNKEKNYTQKINKKMNRLAVLSVLSRKLHDGEIKILNDFNFEAPKTKFAAAALRRILNVKNRISKYDVAVIPDPENKAVYRAVRNLPKTKAISPLSLNVPDLINYKNIFMDKASVSAIEKQFKSTVK